MSLYVIDLAAGWASMFAACILACLLAKPEPEPEFVVEPLDDEWAVLWRVVGGPL